MTLRFGDEKWRITLPPLLPNGLSGKGSEKAAVSTSSEFRVNNLIRACGDTVLTIV